MHCILPFTPILRISITITRNNTGGSLAAMATLVYKVVNCKTCKEGEKVIKKTQTIGLQVNTTYSSNDLSLHFQLMRVDHVFGFQSFPSKIRILSSAYRCTNYKKTYSSFKAFIEIGHTCAFSWIYANTRGPQNLRSAVTKSFCYLAFSK